MTIIFIFLIAFGLFSLFSFIRRRQILQLFKDGNVIVTGLRGRGKDLLFSFVTNSITSKNRKKKRKSLFKRKKSAESVQYISNVDYTNGNGYIEFNARSDFSVGGNKFANFVADTFIPYEYPHPDNVDYFISDAGIYFPSQYNEQLNKLYPSAPLFQALSRHLGNCNVHCNVQNLNRLWDKLREQADIYILCDRCRVFKIFKRVYIKQRLYVYDKYDSCLERRKPFPFLLLRGREGRMRKAEFEASYGMIKKVTLRHVLKNKYDDRVFKTKLQRGLNNE